MIYSDYVTALSTMMSSSSTDPDFVAILPRCIEYAEERCYRELNLAATQSRNITYALTAGVRNLVLPVGTFVVLEGVNLITPVGTVNPELGVRARLVRMSWDALDLMYGSSPVGPPRFFALQDAATIAFGPWPDLAYPVELIGTIRPTAISASNTTTTLSTYFPDLFLAASMIFMCGFQRDFGQQADDPQAAMSWTTTYDTLLKGAIIEEARKKGIPVSGDV